MELEDMGCPTLGSVLATSDAEIALKNVDVAVFVGGFPRKQGMERKDLIATNSKIFVAQGKALEKVASKKVKVLVVANPANTNCWILTQNAPSIPKENFTALTFLDLNRARATLAKRAGVPVESIRRVAIFGNHSATQVPDSFNASILKQIDSTSSSGKPQELPAPQVIRDDVWLKGDFIKTVQQRGKAIIDARKLSSALSAAHAITDHLRAWQYGTNKDSPVSMAIYTNRSYYGIKEGLMFSFPVTITSDGKIQVVENFKLDGDMQKLLKLTEKELEEEKQEALMALQSTSKL
jgi:malate dehydrogenase